MFLSESLGFNEKGNLTIGGLDTVDLVNEYKTPLYVMDEALIRKNCRLYLDSLKKACGEDGGLALYASKAFSCVSVLKIAAEEGMGLDVVSGGELYTAKTAGFPMDRIYFHGNNKTYDEIEFALTENIGRFVADNLGEIEDINEIAGKQGKIASILLRIKPGVDAHTHDFIMTGQIDSKFGFGIETGEAMEAVKKAISCKNVNLVGIHCHIGSQIFEIEPFVEAAKIMVKLMKDIKDETGIELSELNLGGGYGIQYTESDDPIGYGDYIGDIAKTVRELTKEYSLKMPKILMEPGRSLVASAGITLYKIGVVKDIPGVRTYVSVDGGMADNPRYIMYGAPYTAIVANKANQKAERKVTIAGKCCESGDLIQENTYLANPERGDVLAVFATGAYNYSMSSNYNRIPKPAVVMIKNGKSRIVVKRQSYEDVIRNDVLED